MCVYAVYDVYTLNIVSAQSTVLEEESPDSSTKAAEPPPKVIKSTPQPGTDRKTRRKAKLEPMIEPEIEEGERTCLHCILRSYCTCVY